MAPATPTGGARPRTRRPSAHVTRDLLDAAAVEFAAHGFTGASTRRIAERAGAHQPQINYHFTSKDQLWRATVDHLFSLMDARLPSVLDGPALAATFEAMLRAFILFSADHPELDRIINLEATIPSDRLDWLVDRHLQPRFDAVSTTWTMVRAAGLGADLAAAEVWEIITGYGAMHFANAPLLRKLGVHSGDGRAEAAAHADRMLVILVPRGPSRPITAP